MTLYYDQYGRKRITRGPAQPEMTVPEYEAHLNTLGRGKP